MLRNNLYTVRKVSNFCKNDYNLAENTKILARSIFCSSANFGPLVTTDGALELCHQGEFVLGKTGTIYKFGYYSELRPLGGGGGHWVFLSVFSPVACLVRETMLIINDAT